MNWVILEQKILIAVRVPVTGLPRTISEHILMMLRIVFWVVSGVDS